MVFIGFSEEWRHFKFNLRSGNWLVRASTAASSAGRSGRRRRCCLCFSCFSGFFGKILIMPFFITRYFNGKELSADAENLNKNLGNEQNLILIPCFLRNTLLSDQYEEDGPW